MADDSSVPKLFSTEEVGALFGVNARAVRRWVSDKRLGAKVLGRRLKFTTRHINDFIRSLPDASAVRQGIRGGKK